MIKDRKLLIHRITVISLRGWIAPSQSVPTKSESAPHRPSLVPRQTKFGLAVDERTRNNLCAIWSELTWSDRLTLEPSDQIPIHQFSEQFALTS